MSATSGAILELEGEPASPPGRERRSAIVIAFSLGLVVASAFVGRDGPAETVAVEPAATLSLPTGTTDAVLFTFPDRLANEAPPRLLFIAVRVRTTEGLGLEAARPGDIAMVTWTERGTAYWLSSNGRDVADLVRLAGTLH